jgi:hypothetical protein
MSRQLITLILTVLMVSCSQAEFSNSGKGKKKGTEDLLKESNDGEVESLADGTEADVTGKGSDSDAAISGQNNDNLGDVVNGGNDNVADVVGQDGDVLGDLAISDPQSLYDTCQAVGVGNQQVLTESLVYPDYGGNCSLAATNHNGSGIVGFYQELLTLQLPEGAVICGLAIDSEGATLASPTTDFHYDDVEFLTLGENVIFTTHRDYIDSSSGQNHPQFLPQTGDLVTFDKDIVSASPLEPLQSGNEAWCIGDANSDCLAPPVDIAGPIRIRPDDRAFADLAYKMYSEDIPFDFGLTSAGDGNADCIHTELALEFSFRYITP